MPKILIFLLTLSLLCNCKEQQPVPKEEEKFESSINKVVFSHEGLGIFPSFWSMAVTKTETGALAKYKKYSSFSDSSFLEAEFSVKEWQNFIKALYSIRFNEWQKEYKEIANEIYYKWNLDIFSSDKKEDYSFYGENAVPQDWERLVILMNSLEKKALAREARKKEFPIESKIKMEYEKKFRKPISDFELSLKEISFSIHSNYIDIYRTKTGATLRDRSLDVELELSLEEWLDFIRAIHKCDIEEWERKEENEEESEISQKSEWELTVYSSDEYDSYTFSGKDTYPPNWKKFKKIMDDMMARTRKIRKEEDDKLKTEYQKKFGSPISDFELSIRCIRLGTTEIQKTETGAVAERSSWGKIELSLDEWMDLIRIIKEWDGKYNKENSSDTEWEITTYSSFIESKYFGGDTYPPNWAEFEKKREDIRKRIIRSHRVELVKKLEVEYQKRFGEPISDFELAIEDLTFSFMIGNADNDILVQRNDTGAIASYLLRNLAKNTYYHVNSYYHIKIDITTEEWLDFIRTLRKCQVEEWKDNYGKFSRPGKMWFISIGQDVYARREITVYYNASPPNWDEFKKTMDNFLARIKAEGREY